MNKSTKIKVRTAVGESKEINAFENLAQGSIDSAIVSSNNLSKGVDDFFSTSDSEFYYVSLKLLPQIYQDDLFRVLQDPLSAQLGNDRFENLAHSKQLKYNLKKSLIIILGSKKARSTLEEDFMNNPPMLYGKKMQIKKQGTYLGEEIRGSLSESVTLTINKRIGLVRKSIFEIKHIIEDCRSQVVGGIQCGLLFW